MTRRIRFFWTCLILASAVLPAAKAQFPDFDNLEQGLRSQAQAGDAEAQFQLGIRLAIGEGLRKNAQEGAKWLEKAANGGHAKAMHVLGTLYEEGQGVEKSDSKAADWYEKAAEKDLPDAQFSLAMLYQNGRGVEKAPRRRQSSPKKLLQKGSLQPRPSMPPNW